LQKINQKKGGVQVENKNKYNVDLSDIKILIERIDNYTGDGVLKVETLAIKIIDEFLKAIDSSKKIEDGDACLEILEKIDGLLPLRDTYVDFLESIMAIPTSRVITLFFERLYDHINSADVKYGGFDTECYNFLIWELFIATAAVLIRYERFNELNKIMTHAYVLQNGRYVGSFKYKIFRSYMGIIEGEVKPKSNEPKLLSLAKLTNPS